MFLASTCVHYYVEPYKHYYVEPYKHYYVEPYKHYYVEPCQQQAKLCIIAIGA
jgi:hypothetical protein